jgi:hypothetical protein
MYAETETMLLFQTVTHPQPPLKRGVSVIALWKRISPLLDFFYFFTSPIIIHNLLIITLSIATLIKTLST